MSTEVLKRGDMFVIAVSHGLVGPQPRISLAVSSHHDLGSPEVILSPRDAHGLLIGLLKHANGAELYKYAYGRDKDVVADLNRIRTEMADAYAADNLRGGRRPDWENLPGDVSTC